jgi:outer membrane receptor protein involved in Fe transport
LHPLEENQMDEKIINNNTERFGHRGKEYNEVIFVANVAYKNEFTDKSKFEAGANLNLDHIPRVTSVSGRFDEAGNITPFVNLPANQEVDFIQDVYAAYGIFKSGWGKFEYQLGFRAEWTNRKSNYSYSNNEGNTIIIPAANDFWDFFPSFHSVYNFSENHQLALNYSSRIKRPDYYNLIPLYQYSSPYSYYTGNAKIMPSYSNAFELSYKKSWTNNFVGVELFARNTNKVIQTFSRVDSLGLIFQMPENVGDSWSVGTEFMTGVDLFKWWNINISTSLFSYKLWVSIDDTNYTQSQLRSDSRLNNTFLLPRDFTLKWDLNYQSPTLTAQNKQEGYFYSNLAIKKSFNEKLWDVSLAFYNIFNSIKYSSTNTGKDFRIESSYTIKPVISLKIAYNFNNQE